ncbi:unnamed protein product [marine sediment metagenome]|uniref:Uncharacterized protein n=1 Tax=marine sediment metagenome TaxID=412755 RepID=X1MJ05_9ZZZZ
MADWYFYLNFPTKPGDPGPGEQPTREKKRSFLLFNYYSIKIIYVDELICGFAQQL